MLCYAAPYAFQPALALPLPSPPVSKQPTIPCPPISYTRISYAAADLSLCSSASPPFRLCLVCHQPNKSNHEKAHAGSVLKRTRASSFSLTLSAQIWRLGAHRLSIPKPPSHKQNVLLSCFSKPALFCTILSFKLTSQQPERRWGPGEESHVHFRTGKGYQYRQGLGPNLSLHLPEPSWSVAALYSSLSKRLGTSCSLHARANQ